MSPFPFCCSLLPCHYGDLVKPVCKRKTFSHFIISQQDNIVHFIGIVCDEPKQNQVKLLQSCQSTYKDTSGILTCCCSCHFIAWCITCQLNCKQKIATKKQI